MVAIPPTRYHRLPPGRRHAPLFPPCAPPLSFILLLHCLPFCYGYLSYSAATLIFFTAPQFSFAFFCCRHSSSAAGFRHRDFSTFAHVERSLLADAAARVIHAEDVDASLSFLLLLPIVFFLPLKLMVAFPRPSDAACRGYRLSARRMQKR